MRKKIKKTAGKTARQIPTIRRQQLVRFGITDYIDMLRVLYPEDYPFDYEDEGISVKIESAEDVLPPEAYQKLLHLKDDYPIQMGQCHMNAYRVSSCLESFGVLYCDGYYTDVFGRALLHSFCKYNGRYFDPTVEFGYGSSGLSLFTYYSSRTFDPNEIKVFFATASYMDYHLKGRITSTPSTLDFDFQEDDDAPYCYMIDDYGNLKWVDNPYRSSSSQ